MTAQNIMGLQSEHTDILKKATAIPEQAVPMSLYIYFSIFSLINCYKYLYSILCPTSYNMMTGAAVKENMMDVCNSPAEDWVQSSKCEDSDLWTM